jgi:predicted TIM-barrel fold metal-dependent hydrolase
MIIDFRITGTGVRFFPGGYDGLPPFLDRYKELYDFKRLAEQPFETFLADMKRSGVTYAVLQAEYTYGSVEALNRTVAETVAKNKDTLIGFAGLDPVQSEDPVHDLDRYIREWNLKGLNLQPWVQGLYPNDKRYYPIYEYLQEKGLPVTIHSSINFSLHRGIEYSHPLLLDHIACDFPRLTIVANHGGWPWVAEAVAVAWKHRNVFLEIGGVSPKYIAKQGSGWEPLLAYAAVLQDQILFATDSIVSHERVVKEANELPLKDVIKEKLLYRNAMRILDWPKA